MNPRVARCYSRRAWREPAYPGSRGRAGGERVVRAGPARSRQRAREARGVGLARAMEQEGRGRAPAGRTARVAFRRDADPHARRRARPRHHRAPARQERHAARPGAPDGHPTATLKSPRRATWRLVPRSLTPPRPRRSAPVQRAGNGCRVRVRFDPDADPRGHEGRQGQRPSARQAAQAERQAGGASRRAVSRWRAHRQRTRGAVPRHPLDDLPRDRTRRRTHRARLSGGRCRGIAATIALLAGRRRALSGGCEGAHAGRGGVKVVWLPRNGAYPAVGSRRRIWSRWMQSLDRVRC